MISPLFQKKVYDWLHFSGLVYKRPHFPEISRYMHIFFVQRFFEAACSLGIQWTDCNICLTTSNKWVQKLKDCIWMGQHFRRPSIWMSPFFKGQVYEWVRFRNTGPNTCTTITPKLPPPPPPPLPRTSVGHLNHSLVYYCQTGRELVFF